MKSLILFCSLSILYPAVFDELNALNLRVRAIAFQTPLLWNAEVRIPAVVLRKNPSEAVQEGIMAYLTAATQKGGKPGIVRFALDADPTVEYTDEGFVEYYRLRPYFTPSYNEVANE